MRTRFLRGDTAQNNTLTLPEGEFSIDEEKKALRVHDGQTLGGFEIVGTRAYEPIGPGPTELVGGDDQWGFYGEVLASDFITGDALASAIGLSAGTGQFSNTEWLKFNSNEKKIYVPKKPIRHSVSWGSIDNVGGIYGDGLTVTIDNHIYSVSLMKGASNDPTNGVVDHDNVASYGSEWNRLMYPIHSGVHINDNNPVSHTDPNSAPFGSWANYSDYDLHLDNSTGLGTLVWMRETSSNTTTKRVRRGMHGVTLFDINLFTVSTGNAGWRPRLELIS